MDHADLPKILVHFQHGFRKGQEYQMINPVKDMCGGLNQTLQCLTFPKHLTHFGILDTKLKYYGVRGSTFNIMEKTAALIACT